MASRFKGIPLKIEQGKYLSMLYEGIDYKEFWQETPKHNLDELEHALVCELLPASGQRIIDVGCGFGRLANCYLDRFKESVLLDGSMTLLRQARETIQERAVYVAADANYMPFKNASFDCALMIRVFHHLPNSRFILGELHRIIGNSGNLIFDYSNKRSLHQIFRWLIKRKNENPFHHKPVGIGTPFISHHPGYVDRVLAQSGFEQTGCLGAGVMDKLGGFAKLLPSGKAAAPFLGKSKFAPWIQCKAVTHEGAPVSGAAIEELLACPLCHTDLKHMSAAYECSACGRLYPITDGIPDFRFG